jgi:predicted Zn-ribbon and HTH transcriptional regulator
MLSISQPILTALLTAKNTAPERLSDAERRLADRVCRCVLCGYLWVRRKGKLPERCPNCHKRSWDTPYLTALMSEEKAKQGLTKQGGPHA